MKTLREKIEEKIKNKEQLLQIINSSWHGCAYRRESDIIKFHRIMGELTILNKTLQWLDEEEASFEEQVNGMNDEAKAAMDSITPERLFDFVEELKDTKVVPYQLCPKCKGGRKLPHTFIDCHICHGEGIIPMHKE